MSKCVPICKQMKETPILQIPNITVSIPNKNDCNFNIFVCNFARTYEQNKQDQAFIGRFTPREMLHTATGLYSVSLSSMDKTTIYDTLDEKSTVTLFLLKSENECFEHIAKHYISSNNHNNSCLETVDPVKKYDSMEKLKHCLENLTANNGADDDEYESSSEAASEFDLIFGSEISKDSSDESADEDEEESGVDEESDEEDDEEDEENEEENESNDRVSKCSSNNSITSNKSVAQSCSSAKSGDTDHSCSRGYNKFVASCLQRKIKIKEIVQLKKKTSDCNILVPLIGPEHQIAAACTFRIRHVEPKKRIVHIIFLSVRKHLRRFGLGTKIINIIKDKNTCGDYDAVVVHADVAAIPFFKKNDFFDDPLLNRQWSSFASEYINCTLMTFFPPLNDCKHLLNDPKEIKIIDEAVENWLDKSAELHETQLSLFKRLREEIKQLRMQVQNQSAIIHKLTIQLFDKKIVKTEFEHSPITQCFQGDKSSNNQINQFSNLNALDLAAQFTSHDRDMAQSFNNLKIGEDTWDMKKNR